MGLPFLFSKQAQKQDQGFRIKEQGFRIKEQGSKIEAGEARSRGSGRSPVLTQS